MRECAARTGQFREVGCEFRASLGQVFRGGLYLGDVPRFGMLQGGLRVGGFPFERDAGLSRMGQLRRALRLTLGD